MVQRKWDKKLGSPYNDCASDVTSPNSIDSVLYKHINRGIYSYSKRYCFDLCNDLEVLQRCNCTQGFKLKNHKDCSDIALENFFFGNNTKGTCSMILNKNFYKEDYKKCIPLCPEVNHLLENLNYLINFNIFLY